MQELHTEDKGAVPPPPPPPPPVIPDPEILAASLIDFATKQPPKPILFLHHIAIPISLTNQLVCNLHKMSELLRILYINKSNSSALPILMNRSLSSYSQKCTFEDKLLQFSKTIIAKLFSPTVNRSLSPNRK